MIGRDCGAYVYAVRSCAFVATMPALEGQIVFSDASETLTVRALGARWIAARRDRGSIRSMVSRWKTIDEVIGDRPAADLGERGVLDLRRAVEAKPGRRGPMTAGSVRNFLKDLRFAYGEAIRDGLLECPNPVTRRTLPDEGPGRGEWDEEYFTVGELPALLLDRRVRIERIALRWVMTGTGARPSDASGLLVGDWLRDRVPLSGLRFVRQWHTQLRAMREPKGNRKVVPVHPHLEQFLTWWIGEGWCSVFGRAPATGDLLVPAVDRDGAPRPWRSDRARRDLLDDLETLGLRRRLVRDFRRTFKTLAEDAGVSTRIVEAALHPKRRDVASRYDAVPYATRCRELAKLPLPAWKAEPIGQLSLF